MFSARILQTSIPSVPSQASEPAEDSNQENEYEIADDSNTSGDTQEAEIVGAAHKRSTCSPNYEAL